MAAFAEEEPEILEDALDISNEQKYMEASRMMTAFAAQ